jgi:hypothetical protein
MVDLAVFVCYRRSDASAEAGRLYEALRRRYGRDRLFMDVGIVPGDDWVDAIEHAVSSCDVMLAVIGREWAGATDEEGRLRLMQTFDRVRLELETALRLGKPVIPVLVEEAAMPDNSQLPESLRPMHRRQAVRISHATFETDFAALQRGLRTIERKKQSATAAPAVAVASADEPPTLPPTPAEPVPAAPQPLAVEQPAAVALTTPAPVMEPPPVTERPNATPPSVSPQQVAGSSAQSRRGGLVRILAVGAIVLLVGAAFIYSSLFAPPPLGGEDANDRLLSHVPESISASCEPHEGEGASIAGVICYWDDGAFVKYWLYESSAAMDAAFEPIAGDTAEGDCSDTTIWPIRSSTAAGQALCTWSGGTAQMFWTNAQLKIMSRADYSNAGDLYQFWQEEAGPN